MQQLYLTGDFAPEMADRLFTALNVCPAGYRLIAFTVGGAVRGEVLHLLMPPAAPMDNDVPCRVRLRSGDWTIVPRVLDEIAAPNLLRAAEVHTPILLGGLTAQMLTCTAFREAVVAVLMSPRPVIVAAEDGAEELLRALTPSQTQLWMPVPPSEAGRAELLEELVAEAAMRF